MHGGERLIDWENQICRYLGEDRWRVLCLDEVGSTMDVARAEHGEDARPLLVIAARQVRGRGTHGREWVGPPRGFFSTIALRVPLAVDAQPRLAGVSLVVGLAVAEALVGSGCDIRLKWPNDLYTEDYQKLGGVLVETASVPRELRLAIGIGVNLADPPPSTGAGSLRDAFGVELTPVEVASTIADRVVGSVLQALSRGFAVFRHSWEQRALLIGQSIVCEVDSEINSGLFRGVDDEGRLLLESVDGHVRPLMSARIQVPRREIRSV